MIGVIVRRVNWGQVRLARQKFRPTHPESAILVMASDPILKRRTRPSLKEFMRRRSAYFGKRALVPKTTRARALMRWSRR